MFESIAADRRETVRSALKATFGSKPLSKVQPITSGASAHIYRLDAGDRPFLLRVESLLRDAVRNPQRSFVCMRTAAEAGLAPRMLYADPAAGVAIMDYVEGRPLARFPGGSTALAGDVGTLLRRLQETSIFPPSIGYPAVLADMLARLTEAGLFADGLLEPHRAGFARIREAYRWDDSALVSSHNDPHPGNMLFDGSRLWLIDWETAYRNDPIVDVAVTTLYLAPSSEAEEALLRSWLGRPPNALLRARLVLMRQLVKLFYGMANGLYVAMAQPGLIESSLAAPTPAEFRSAMDEGRLVPNSLEAQRVGGKVALRAFVEGLETAAFADALDVVQRG